MERFQPRVVAVVAVVVAAAVVVAVEVMDEVGTMVGRWERRGSETQLIDADDAASQPHPYWVVIDQSYPI